MRTPAEDDWPMIAELADLAVEHVSGAPEQSEWVANRRAFRGEQMHLVGERCGVVAGYGGIERRPGDPAGTYRIFVVTRWTHALDVADALYRRLEEELLRRKARTAWLREYAADTRVSDFVLERGFVVRERYELNGFEMVTLVKELLEGAPAS